jgi:hypothetical protein
MRHVAAHCKAIGFSYGRGQKLPRNYETPKETESKLGISHNIGKDTNHAKLVIINSVDIRLASE